MDIGNRELSREALKPKKARDMKALIRPTLLGRIVIGTAQLIAVMCAVLESIGIDSDWLAGIGVQVLHSLATPECWHVEIVNEKPQNV